MIRGGFGFYYGRVPNNYILQTYTTDRRGDSVHAVQDYAARCTRHSAERCKLRHLEQLRHSSSHELPEPLRGAV